MSTTPFLVFSTMILFLLALIWTKSDKFNFLVKVIFFCGGVWGLILTLIAFGFLVKV